MLVDASGDLGPEVHALGLGILANRQESQLSLVEVVGLVKRDRLVIPLDKLGLHVSRLLRFAFFGLGHHRQKDVDGHNKSQHEQTDTYRLLQLFLLSTARASDA